MTLALPVMVPATANAAAGDSGLFPTPTDILHVAALHSAGFRGQGVSVGIIARGARSLQDLIKAGILPPKVETLSVKPGTGDQGDRMMQVVHDMAPQAKLGFCAAGNARDAVTCADALITRFHAQVIVDDVNPEPVLFWPGTKAAGYRQLHTRFPTVLFFTGAGSDGAGYYQAAYSSTTVDVGHKDYTAQNFGASAGDSDDPYNEFTLPAGATARIVLGWNDDPNHNPSTDACAVANNEISLVLLTLRGDVLASDQGPCPLESVQYTNPGKTPQRLRIAILLNAPTDTSHLQFKLLAVDPTPPTRPWRLSHVTPGAAGIAATMPNMIAVNPVDPHTGYRSRYILERSANAGPQCQDFAQDTASGRQRRLPRTRCWQQPALVAPDRIMVHFASPTPPGYRLAPFHGDAAAASEAAGAAALLLSAKVRAVEIPTLLRGSATAQAPKPGWDAHYGWGLLNVRAAALRAGVLKGTANRPPKALPPTRFRATQAFRHWRALAHRADHGDPKALAALERGAEHDPVAQTWLGVHYAHSGNADKAAHWYLQAAASGEPLGQALLGSAFERGNGLPQDSRAAYAWWRRSARTGLPMALYELGRAYTEGRGTRPDRQLGYALLLAARERDYRQADAALVRAARQLQHRQRLHAQSLAHRFLRDPATVP
ncbi:MAG: hypothetical protein P8180_12255 [Gammaproteobacteria bacterium]